MENRISVAMTNSKHPAARDLTSLKEPTEVLDCSSSLCHCHAMSPQANRQLLEEAVEEGGIGECLYLSVAEGTLIIPYAATRTASRYWNDSWRMACCLLVPCPDMLTKHTTKLAASQSEASISPYSDLYSLLARTLPYLDYFTTLLFFSTSCCSHGYH